MANISPGAIVDKTACLGDNVTIGPGCIIGPEVVIGPGCELRSNVLVCKGTTIGANNRIFHGVVLGEEPQNVGEVDPPTHLSVGDNNVIREYVTIHRGSPGGGGKTNIGSKNFIMAYCHIGHDCQLGNNIVMTNSCQLSGHVKLEDNVWLAGVCAVHQFTTVGRFAYLAGGSQPSQDIPPFLKSQGAENCCPRAVNSIGLLRNGFSRESVQAIRQAFKDIYIGRGSRSIEALVNDMLQTESLDENVRYMLEFLSRSFSSPKKRFRELSRSH